MKIALVGFSKTGNTFMFMDYLKDYLPEHDDFRFHVSDDEDVVIDFKEYDLIILGTNTWGDGKIPKNCKKVVIDNAKKYNKEWIVFGTGNTIFPHYCRAVDSIGKILSETGNTIVATLKYEQRFNIHELSHEEYQTLKNIVCYINKKEK